MLGEAVLLTSMRDKNDDGHCQPERQDEYGQKGLWSKKVTITFSDALEMQFLSNCPNFFWEIERGEEFCSCPIDVICVCVYILFWQSLCMMICTYFNKSPPPTPGCNFVKIFADGPSAVN